MKQELRERAPRGLAGPLDELRVRPGGVRARGMLIMVCLGALASAGAACSSAEEPTGSAASALEPLDTTCVTIQRGLLGAVADAEIRIDKPTKSYGALADAQVGATPGGTERRMLLRFDLGMIPEGAPVTSAIVTLRGGNGGVGTIGLHPITAPWDEATVTWDSLGFAFAPAPAGSFDASAYAANHTAFDVKDLVQAWVDGIENDGMLLKKGNLGGSVATFDTSERANVEDRPALAVCYQDLCNAVTCAAQDACHLAGACDPKTGLCSSPLAPDGTPCDDGLACTGGGTCAAGVCASGAHLECQEGPPLPLGCSPCVDQVCMFSPYCCTDAWDIKCTMIAKAECPDTCPGFCGDYVCAANEGCASCPHDCDVCPPPPPSCLACGDLFENEVGPACPGSDALYAAAMTCLCIDTCPIACASFCAGGPPEPTCVGCVSAGCWPELMACFQDQPPPPFCGDGACGVEGCASCPEDCGPCPTCPPELVSCVEGPGIVCVDVSFDWQNCGACGNICTGGQTCADGVCTSPVCGDGVCALATEDCTTCPGDCGCACHDECVPGAPQMPSCSSCVSQVCAVAPWCCVKDWWNECVALSFQLCGLCAPVCGDGICAFFDEDCAVCPDDCGVCPPCEPGYTQCGPYCADLQNDWTNCGACGVLCDKSQPCENGVCVGGGLCGDKVCAPSEGCKACPEDCGPCT
ncbi:MAG: DNRLRE domain-containing protein [Byssovorax sp.]